MIRVQLGMIGLGRMGANMVRRLMRNGHTCVVYDRAQAAVEALVAEGASGASSLESFVEQLAPPRAMWLMVPAAVVDSTLDELVATGGLQADDALIDGGNSYFVDDIRRAAQLGERQLEYVDVGTSGGIHGLERGYCLMIGGKTQVVQRLDPIFKALSPGASESPATGTSTAELGYLYCGQTGAGHFVKMVHNAIEYGIMEAYAEGFNVLKHADIGEARRTVDAETTPLRDPERYRYEFDVAAVAEVWRHGSVVSSWLLDLTANALRADPELSKFAGHVSDSGEGRWTLAAAIDESVPAPVLSAALFQRFSSRGEDMFAEQLLSAMRYQFGGHVERFVGE
jgi:6-phosphogluconate dehydrogenase